MNKLICIFLALVVSVGFVGKSNGQFLSDRGQPQQGLNNTLDPNLLPLETSGRFIVDKNGDRVRLACVNWYQAHLSLHTVGGLNVRIPSGF